MSDLRKAAEKALEALDQLTDDVDGTGLSSKPSFDSSLDAITALRAALAQPEQEPEPWMGVSDNPYASDADCNDPNGRAMSWHNKLQTLAQPVMFNGLTEAETNASASVMGLTPPKRKPLTEDVLKEEFAKLYKNDAAILHLAENNRDYAVESIGARHHWAAFKSGARAIERAHGIGGEE